MRVKKTILCVDDHEISLSITKLMLETRGYRVLTANSARRALELFQAGGIDLVMSDFMMPDMDGAALITAIKAMSPATPAILFSGKIKVFEQEVPADVLYPKGQCVPLELLDRIRLLLVKKRGPKKALVNLEKMHKETSPGPYLIA